MNWKSSILIILVAVVVFCCKKDEEEDIWLERSFCSDECVFANDGECDDGVEGYSVSDYCNYGTDCSDCGVRVDVRKKK